MLALFFLLFVPHTCKNIGKRHIDGPDVISSKNAMAVKVEDFPLNLNVWPWGNSAPKDVSEGSPKAQ